MTRVLVIDNYDSFTWNLVHLVAPLVSGVEVVRNDALTTDEVLAADPDAIVLSPGPCTPNEAGICLDLVERVGSRIPVFGVCLGLQTIGQVYGGTVSRAPLPMHGKVSDVEHHGQTIFRGINGPFKATRYHSLIVDRETCPAGLAVTAETADGLIMGLSHRHLPVHGVQFHPESILSEHGVTIMRNFFDLAASWNAAHRQGRNGAPAAGH
ncbi:aminodeoxychorismate/anthranilate synthase component II [Microvirga sp. 17 mud 1-3]|uniref:anthranilate synthase component II n=1 Tax=Microvirga sp. 17 mud 1-3 TaxID=2082949 RepID=UPI000D6C75BB|nr:aminodeoxychorismate/anthranilate synthase component II [Microvirga sp. 17 mud 1-3]AWM89084.1 aminodeoxychorismate/anthranilate synthase component II [Microvirga sp. 17 mud 1-3]